MGDLNKDLEMKRMLGDQLANANGNASKSGNRRITVKITNESEDDQIVVICPGSYSDVEDILDGNGEAADLIISDSEENGVTTTVSKNRVAKFLAYLQANNLHIKGLRLIVDNAEQLQKPLFYRSEDIFNRDAGDEIIPAEFKNENQTDANIATISLDEYGWILGADAVLTYEMGAGRTAQIVFEFGEDFKPSQVVEAKVRMNSRK